MENLGSRFTRLTVLNILANVTVPLVGLVDAAMLGHLPDIRFLAGTALASVLFDYIFWSLNFLRMSTTGLTAQARGRGDHQEATQILYRSLSLAAVLGFAILLLHPLIRQMGFALLQVTPDLAEPAGDYFRGRIWGAPAALANFAFLGWYLGREESGRALVMTLTANLANVALNYLLIIRFGWAAFGAGVATACSQVLMLLVALVLFRALSKPSRKLSRWRWAEVLRRDKLVALFHLNSDILLRTLFLTSALAAFTAMSGKLGSSTLVINTLVLRLMIFAAYFIDGVAFAIESLAGVFHGARDSKGLRRLLRLALISGEVVAGVFLVIYLAIPKKIFSWLTAHEDIIIGGAETLPWLIPVLLFGAPAFIYDGLFLGLTAGKRLRNAMLLSTVGVFFPIAIVALMQGSNGGLWLALAAWMAARTVTLAVGSRGLLDATEGAP